MIQYKAFATISDKNSSWTEDFNVSSRENAENEIKQVVEYFNETIKPGECIRKFEKVERIEDDDIPDDDDINDWDSIDDYEDDEDDDDY